MTENKCTPDETDKIIQHSEEKKGVLSSSVVPSNGHRQGRGEGGGGGGGGGGGIGSFLGSGCSWWNIVSVLAQSCDGASITGEGSSVMVEWSTPTAATLLRTLQHLKEHYKLFGAIEAGKDDGDLHVASDEEQELVVARSTTEKEQESTADQGTTAFDTASVLQSLSKMALSFKFTDANAFFYDLIPGKIVKEYSIEYVHAHDKKLCDDFLSSIVSAIAYFVYKCTCKCNMECESTCLSG